MARKMQARYAGYCSECGGRTAVGETVYFNGRGKGVRHVSAQECEWEREAADSRAEQVAEMRMEAWAEARMTGTTSTFWEDQDYARGRFDGDYGRGYYETKLAQQAGPAGSAAREAAYMEMERAAYNRGEDY